MLLVVFCAMTIGNTVNPVWIPWFCAIFTGAIAATFFWQTVTALLTAADATFVCIAVDRATGHVYADDAARPAIYKNVEVAIQKAQPIHEGAKKCELPGAGAAPPKAASVV